MITAAQYAGIKRKPVAMWTDEEKRLVAEYDEFTDKVAEQARQKREQQRQAAEAERQQAALCTPEWMERQLEAITQQCSWKRVRIANLDVKTVYNHLVKAYKLEVVSVRGGEFRNTENLNRTAEQLAGWLCERPKVGLLLYGYVGVGKTTLARAARTIWQLCAKQQCMFVSASQIAECPTNSDKFRKLKEHPALFIDDLGTESVYVKDYGNDTTPLVTLITERYDKMLFTVITTNLNFDEIKEKYGERISDRLREMCSVVDFDENQKSYRK